jgi:hypothetical protein
MMEPIVKSRPKGFPIFGIFLILLGIGLILSKLHFLHYRWGIILWTCLGVAGCAAVVQAFITRRRGVVFWGSLLFFTSIVMILHRLELLNFAPWDDLATFSLALGLSFLMLFLYDPRRFGVLVPVFFFGGYGVLYYLWWWDVIDWFEMKHYLHLYWPVLIIFWGLSLVFRPRRR